MVPSLLYASDNHVYENIKSSSNHYDSGYVDISYHKMIGCFNHWVVTLPYLQTSWEDSGYEKFVLVNCICNLSPNHTLQLRVFGRESLQWYAWCYAVTISARSCYGILFITLMQPYAATLSLVYTTLYNYCMNSTQVILFTQSWPCTQTTQCSHCWHLFWVRNIAYKVCCFADRVQVDGMQAVQSCSSTISMWPGLKNTRPPLHVITSISW